MDNVRGHGISYKRLTFRGHDGSLHPFAVQYPAARHCRREERIAQLLRMFNEYNLLKTKVANIVEFWPGKRKAEDETCFSVCQPRFPFRPTLEWLKTMFHTFRFTRCMKISVTVLECIKMLLLTSM